MENNIDIYTDGAYSLSSKIGGWAFYSPQLGLRVCGNAENTTNNRMELTAILKAIEIVALPNKECNITIHSDSEWSIGAIINNWNIKLNLDLVSTIKNYVKNLNITFNKVKGHSDVAENNIVDSLAVIMTHTHE